MATMSMEVNRSQLTHLFQKHFGRKSSKIKRNFVENLIFVLNGLKPAYLVDCFAPSEAKLAEFLADVRLIGGLTEPRLVVVSSELFVVNVERVRTLMSRDCPNGFQLIDVSKSLAKPRLMPATESCEILTTIFQCLRSKLSDLYSDIFTFSDCDLAGVNQSTVYGLLLGYPVLYWFDVSNSIDGNCLGMQELVVNVVRAKEPAVSEPCFSFSYPTSLRSQLESYVGFWFEKVKSHASFDLELVRMICEGTPVVAL